MATTTSSPLVEVGKFEVTVRLMDDLVPEKITPTVHPDEKVSATRVQRLGSEWVGADRDAGGANTEASAGAGSDSPIPERGATASLYHRRLWDQ